ncbi:MAG: hypothetical protein PHP31_08690 [Lentimicrobiaceae bacterium]|nr:hypothetical protein [Lentimicrobiaceae bacterium]
MNNNILFAATIVAILLAGCAGKAQKANDEISVGEEWLGLVFTCADEENAFCFPDEEKICTERYYDYYTEYMEIFEYPNFETHEEQKAAEMGFQNKWKDIYPVGVKMWSPFGRGNGMEVGQKLKNVSIAHIEGLKYLVTVDYGDGLVFKNEVTLVPHEDAFLIDYFKTELVE